MSFLRIFFVTASLLLSNEAVCAESAGELEVFVDKNLFQLIDTEGGTLEPLCKGLGDGAQLQVEQWLKETGLSLKSKFENLELATKKKLILFIANLKNLDFSGDRSDRIITGLVVKERLTLNEDRKEFSLGSVSLVNGKTVFLRELFESYVEFGNPESSTTSLDVIELHVRNSRVRKGSDLYRGALYLARVLGLQIASVHIHVMHPFPEKMENDVSARDYKLQVYKLPNVSIDQEFLKRIAFLEWVRRVNLVFEVKAILADVEVPYVVDSENGQVYFASFPQEAMAELWAWIVADRPELVEGKIGSGFLALYPPGKYDSQELFGLEIRGLPTELSSGGTEETVRMIDYLQNAQVDFSKGKIGTLLQKGRLDKWFKTLANDNQYSIFNIEMFLQQILPGKDLTDLRFAARRISQSEGRWDFEKQQNKDKINGLFSLKGLSPYWDFIEQLPEECLHRNSSIRYLFHPWQQESFLFDKGKVLAKISDRRWDAFQKIRNGEKPLKAVKEFLVSSGIASEVLRLLSKR